MIYSDLFNQEKHIPNGVEPEFCLLNADTAPAYKITIVDAILYVKKIELTPSVSMPSTPFSMTKMHSTLL